MGAHSSESSSPAVASTALVGSSDPDRGEPAIAHDHPGVPDLFAVLAYGEISAFYRLAEDARMAPSMEGRVALASMAAAEMSHFETLEQALSNRGLDVYSSMDPFVRALDEYHASTTPSTWLESLVKAYVGDGIAADFYRQIAHSLAPDVAEIVRDVLAETGHSEFVVHEVSERVRASLPGQGTPDVVGASTARRGDHAGPVRARAARVADRSRHHRVGRPQRGRRSVRSHAGAACRTDVLARVGLIGSIGHRAGRVPAGVR